MVKGSSRSRSRSHSKGGIKGLKSKKINKPKGKNAGARGQTKKTAASTDKRKMKGSKAIEAPPQANIQQTVPAPSIQKEVGKKIGGVGDESAKDKKKTQKGNRSRKGNLAQNKKIKAAAGAGAARKKGKGIKKQRA